MISFLICTFLFFVGVGLAMWLAMAKVPTGYQDDTGFHEGFEPLERNDRAPRSQ